MNHFKIISGVDSKYIIVVVPPKRSRKKALMKKHNMIICGKPGVGKTRKCIIEAIELLKKTNNNVAIFHLHNEYAELSKINPSALILDQQYPNMKSLLGFLDSIYDAAYKTSATNAYTVFIEDSLSTVVDILELIRRIKKLNSVNVQLRIVVEEFNNVAGYSEDSDIYLPWFKENFSEVILEI